MCYVIGLLFLAVCSGSLPAQSFLASWNDTASRQAIVDFVAKATRPGSPGLDNDATLWAAPWVGRSWT